MKLATALNTVKIYKKKIKMEFYLFLCRRDKNSHTRGLRGPLDPKKYHLIL